PAMSTGSTGNLMLDVLPQEEFKYVQESLQLVQLAAGQTLSTQGEAVDYVYFPTTALVSCRAAGSQGEVIEIYAEGHEGVVEPASILTSIAAVNAEVQIAGDAYRIRIDEICTLIRKTTELPRVLLRFAYSLAVRMVQATKCAMFHTVRQRLVLWLLLALRSHGMVIPCTHHRNCHALGPRQSTGPQ